MLDRRGGRVVAALSHRVELESDTLRIAAASGSSPPAMLVGQSALDESVPETGPV